jgi:cation:H+ antiporter
MLIPFIVIIIGFVVLMLSADRFVAGSAAVAENMGMPPILIGLTVVSLGTSAPEILVSLNAALANESELAVGNALGSNIANIGLVLGVTALFCPLPVLPSLLKRELPILLAATFFGGFLIMDNHLGRSDGLILLGALILIMAKLIHSQSRDPNAANVAELEDLPHMPHKKAWMNFALGLLFLILSARALVWGATEMATLLGLSTLIIGLTIVAVGTSLPELAATMACALKGHNEIAIGNVVGSNLFNLMAVMAIPGIISPTILAEQVLLRDYATMAILTVFLACTLYASMYAGRNKTAPVHKVGRTMGSLLIGLYGMYYYWLFITH